MHYLFKITFIAYLKCGLTPLITGWYWPLRKEATFLTLLWLEILEAAGEVTSLQSYTKSWSSFPCSIFIKISQVEESGSEEFLTVITPKKMSQGLVLTCSSKSYQNDSVPVPSFLKGVSCLFWFNTGYNTWKTEYFSQESHREDERGNPYDHDLLLLVFH